MLAGGLPESTIVMTIRKAAYFGLVDVDTSANALVALKAKGADEQILNAVVWAEPYGDRLKEVQATAQRAAQQKESEERAVPGLPDSSGVYFKGPSGWVRLPSFVFWAPLYFGQAWMQRAHEYSVPIGPRGHSEVQIPGGMLAFYVREPSSNEPWQIVRATSHDDERQLRLTTSPGFGQSETIAGSQVRDIRMTHVAGSIFALHPDAQLGPGEYVLCASVQGGRGLELCYSFGIRP